MIAETLKKHHVKSSFFFTGRFYRNPEFRSLIMRLKKDGHYMGSHSDQHLLYCDWRKRDSLLVSRSQFEADLRESYKTLLGFGIKKKNALFFLPPYEWYNATIAGWTRQEGLLLVNFSPGTRSTADYTYPEMGKPYLPSDEIFKSVIDFELRDKNGMNGFILLVHAGTDPRRKDKFYNRLDGLLEVLKRKGYRFKTIDRLLSSLRFCACLCKKL